MNAGIGGDEGDITTFLPKSIGSTDVRPSSIDQIHTSLGKVKIWFCSIRIFCQLEFLALSTTQH